MASVRLSMSKIPPKGSQPCVQRFELFGGHGVWAFNNKIAKVGKNSGK